MTISDIDDLDAFQRLVPTYNVDAQQLYHDRGQLSLARSFDELFQMTRIPLSLGGVCRKVHEVLTGAKAAKCVEEHGLIEASGMWEIWRDLDRLWRELVAIKETVLRDGGASQRFYVEQYACGWQVTYIFRDIVSLIDPYLLCSFSYLSAITSSGRPSNSIFLRLRPNKCTQLHLVLRLAHRLHLLTSLPSTSLLLPIANASIAFPLSSI